MNHKLFVPTLLILAALTLANCTLPSVSISQPTATPVPSTPTANVTPPPPTAELGLAENPLILALAPSGNAPEQINAAREIASQFMERTGYVVVTIAPDSYVELIDALENGNAHIVLLDPLSYALAYQKDLVRAQFAVVQDGGKIKYGAQFLAPRKSGFISYFDNDAGENTASTDIALAQFNDKKPCWSEETSPSGYVIPLGLLNQAQVQTRPAAFVGGQTTVVRSLYLGGICDFGATYVDARKFPSLENEYPDLVEQVVVIWRVPEIIPYEVLVFSTKMPQNMRDLFGNIIPAVIQTDSGNAAFKSAYDIDALQSVNDGDFKEFHILVDESRIDLFPIINK
ncbi:MAG TPA: PhnD/SsuA/transferrin family substrate-binding protein [Anaerolineales bacterium]|nr:PhnD/SsuA/transferrin family substrate-binding protein [Anaerolineales bacterium]